MEDFGLISNILQVFCTIVQTIVVIVGRERSGQKASEGKNVSESLKRLKYYYSIVLGITILSAFSILWNWNNSTGLAVHISLSLFVVSILFLLWFTYHIKKNFGKRKVSLSSLMNWMFIIPFVFLIPSFLISVFTEDREVPDLIRPNNNKPIKRTPDILDKNSFFESEISDQCRINKIKIWKIDSINNKIINVFGDPKSNSLSDEKTFDFLISQVIRNKVFLFYDGKGNYKVWDMDGKEVEGNFDENGAYKIDGISYKWISINDKSDDTRTRFMHSYDGEYGIEIIYDKTKAALVYERLKNQRYANKYFNEVRRYLFVAEVLSVAKEVDSLSNNSKGKVDVQPLIVDSSQEDKKNDFNNHEAFK